MRTVVMRRTTTVLFCMLILVLSSPAGQVSARRVGKASASGAAIQNTLLSSQDHLVTDIDLVPLTPNVLPLNQNININFKYRTTQAGGVRIFARPMTGNQLTPNYAASGSPLYPTGSGSGTGSFTITTNSVLVTGIRIQMLTADQSSMLFETILPVFYQYGSYWQIFLPFLENKFSS